MKKNGNTAAVILSGGEGERFKGAIPKQYTKVNNRPILYHTLKKVIDCGVFSEIIVVVRKNWVHKVPSMIFPLIKNKKHIKITCIPGGTTRSDSSYNAIKFLKKNPVGYIFFHDAVRPFVDKKVIQEIVAKAKQCGASVTAIKALESVATVKQEKIIQVLPQQDLFFLQTPECYDFDMLIRAYATFSKKRNYFVSATNLHIVSDYKQHIAVVLHPERNLKITFPSDLTMVKKLT